MSRTYMQNRIRELRKAKGFTLEALGAAMESELTPSTVAKLEKGAMALTADYLIEIARVLDVSPGQVLGIDASDATHIPLVEWGRVCAYLTGKAVNMGHVAVPLHLASSSVFAVKVECCKAARLVEYGFVVVDTSQVTLEDLRWYLIETRGAQATAVRFSSNPPAFMPGDSDIPPDPIPLGSEPFTVIGRIVFVGHET